LLLLDIGMHVLGRRALLLIPVGTVILFLIRGLLPGVGLLVPVLEFLVLTFLMCFHASVHASIHAWGGIRTQVESVPV
jgi:uncharacterized membrane protein